MEVVKDLLHSLLLALAAFLVIVAGTLLLLRYPTFIVAFGVIFFGLFIFHLWSVE